jgi:hypothetical protein
VTQTHLYFRCISILSLSALLALAACGDDDVPVVPTDAGTDFGPVVPASTAHCTYVPAPATARAGGTVTTGTLRAGVGERTLDAPVGTGLGAYTARGEGDSRTDTRFMEVAGSWMPSVGIQTAPRVKALALTAGDETVVFVNLDIGDAYDGMTVDIEDGLGPDFHGKVILQISHSHSGWGQFTADDALQIGFGVFRRTVYDRMVERAVAAAQEALDTRQDVKFGIGHNPDWDPTNIVTHDRRGENNDLPRGDRKDTDLYVLRVDRLDDTPLAIVPIFGTHGTINDGNNPLASTDALGQVERALEESFDEHVMVMHLQGSGGDVSPGGAGFDCGADYACQYAAAEQVGTNARTEILALWTDTATSLMTETKMEMLTRFVELGPNWETFTIRGGALRYSPWDGRTRCDGIVYDATGGIVSPIDEFNAPSGAALCGTPTMGPVVFRGRLPGADDLPMYRSCTKIEEAAPVLGQVFNLPPFESPVCATTRTMVSALRIGDYLFTTIPGESTQLLADVVRNGSPYPADHTVVLGYAQGSVGYVLTPEDWLRGGYEPNITFWGPLEGEYIAEKLLELAQLATTDTREDGTLGGSNHWPTPARVDGLPPPDPATALTGTVPATIPSTVYWRQTAGETLASAQPAATMPRLAITRFVFLGEDPMAGTPRITLERESATTPGTFETVTRRSGRPVMDEDMLLLYTPDPLIREGTTAEHFGTGVRTHYWVIEWQAVVANGDGALPAVADRTGLPLGTYRFHVAGTGYTLDSNAFEVEAATLTGAVVRTGTTAAVTGLGYPEVAKAFRMIDSAIRPGAPVPLRSGDLRVQLFNGAAQLGADRTAAVVDGALSLTDADVATATSMKIFDRFDNSITLALTP